MRGIVRAFSLSTGLFVCALDHSASAQSAPGAIAADRGHQLFMTEGCYECHGTVGQGGSAAPRIAPEPLPTDAIIEYIRNPTGEMPPYSAKVLSDAGIADIHDYLAIIKKPDVAIPQ